MSPPYPIEESNMRMSHVISLIALLAGAATAAPARASESKDDIDAMLQVISSECAGMSEQFRKTPGMGSALSARPEKALCDCVGERMNGMPLIAELRGLDDAKLESLVLDPVFKEYLIAKLSAKMFTCVTDELDAGADAIRPKI